MTRLWTLTPSLLPARPARLPPERGWPMRAAAPEPHCRSYPWRRAPLDPWPPTARSPQTELERHTTLRHRAVLYSHHKSKKHALQQGSPDTVLEGRCPAEFSSSPNQTHLKQLIKVLLGILETSREVCWGKLELNSTGHRPPGSSLVTPALQTDIYIHHTSC